MTQDQVALTRKVESHLEQEERMAGKVTEKERQEIRKSRVRVRVTYAATLFLVGGIVVPMLVKSDEATEILFTAL